MARAILRRFRESPRKVRAVADMIRGRSVDDAMSILRLQQRKAAHMLAKVLGSAIANATENEKADADKLFVTNVFIDGGPVTRRWMARSMGRANRIRRRTSHVTVEVDVPESKRRKGRQMGQKTHPVGFRLGVIRGWSSKWYSEKDFSKWLHEDMRLKRFVK